MRTLTRIRYTFTFNMPNEERMKISERISKIILRKSDLFCKRQQRIIEQYKTKLRRSKDLVLVNEVSIDGYGQWYMVCIISFDDSSNMSVTTICFQKFMTIQAKKQIDNGMGFYGIICNDRSRLYNEFSPHFVRKINSGNYADETDTISIVKKLADFLKNSHIEYDRLHTPDMTMKFIETYETGKAYGYKDHSGCHFYTTFILNEEVEKTSAVV